jgi:hypothetical protein
MTIYLYIKTHKITGLKYLGKTIKNPYKYDGSGIDWVDHLKKYGYDHYTDILMECKSKEELGIWGRYYSRYYNIITAQDDYGNRIWANRIPETGAGQGGILGRKRGEEFSKKMIIQNKGENNPSYGVYWWTNGIEEKKSKIQPDINWYRGRSSVLIKSVSDTILKKDIRAGKKNTSYGKYWWTNGIDSIKSDKCPDGYHRGVGVIQRNKSRNKLAKS